MLSKPVRLTVVYGLIWTAVLSSLLLYCQTALARQERAGTLKLLASDWDAVRSYLKIERGKPNWYFDREDPYEFAAVSRVRRVFLLRDSQGKVLEVSPAVMTLDRAVISQLSESPSGISEVAVNRNGARVLLLSAELRDEDRQQTYRGVIGRVLARPTPLPWFAVLLLALLSFSISGWMVRHTLREPVNFP